MRKLFIIKKMEKNQCVWMDRNRKYSCPLAINKLVEIDFFFFFCVPKKKSILMIYIFFFQIGFFLSAVQIIFSSSLSSFLFRVFVCYCKQNKTKSYGCRQWWFFCFLFLSGTLPRKKTVDFENIYPPKNRKKWYNYRLHHHHHHYCHWNIM